MAPAKVCQVKWCGQPSFARVTDGKKRRDFCQAHIESCLRGAHIAKENITLVDVWGHIIDAPRHPFLIQAMEALEDARTDVSAERGPLTAEPSPAGGSGEE